MENPSRNASEGRLAAGPTARAHSAHRFVGEVRSEKCGTTAARGPLALRLNEPGGWTTAARGPLALRLNEPGGWTFCIAAIVAGLLLASYWVRPAAAQSNPATTEELLQDNIVIVLDSSGSMRQSMRTARMSRMDAAKAALSAVLEHVPENTHIGLLVFSSSTGQHDWFYDLGPVDRDALVRAIQRPQPGGGTPLGEYLKKGADRLVAQREAQRGYGTFRLLVVTDGEASDPELIDAYLPDLLARGITVDCIGVDMQSDHALATRVHSYRRANDPASLERAVREVVGEVGGDQGQDTDADDTEQFELIAALPDEMCLRLVRSITNISHHPIGQQPVDPLAALDGATTAPGSSAAEAFPPRSVPSGRGQGSGGGIFLAVLGFFCLAVVAVMIGVPILIAVSGRRSSSRRRRGG